MIDADRCLKRIGYIGPTEPSLSTLKDLQKAFLLKVPFENLDIHIGQPIKLSSKHIYEKIVSKKRGGFCYECNILFCNLINGLGFHAEYLSARMVKGSVTGPEYDHMVILVNLEHDYLVDVGNGQSCREPLRIDGTNRAASEGYTYRVGTYGKGNALYYQQSDAAWTPRFIFTLAPRDLTEFSGMCHYHQTSPESVFTQRRLATIATTEGRVTLTDMQLTITKGEKMQERVLTSEEDYRKILKKHFGIEIDR
ncbi:MAG: arylamine N-acetyltransferase [Desulfobacterales bacterium]|nr:MAG: arylamine N-acetyltransferase [Desulfobacterales bacterium]